MHYHNLLHHSHFLPHWISHFSAPFSLKTSFCRSSGCYYVGDTPSTTRCTKIQPFLDVIIPLFLQCLTPRCPISIDEAMIAFRWQIIFQYIRDKPGVLRHNVLSESESGYMYIYLINYGRETELIGTRYNQTTNVVLTLINPLVGLGCDFYTLWFYTSPLKAFELLKLNTTLTGTVMCNGKEMAAAKKGKKSRERARLTQRVDGSLAVDWQISVRNTQMWWFLLCQG